MTISSDQLKSIVERIERLETDKENVSNDIKDVYAEAKNNGFNPKIIKKVLAYRKLRPDERQQFESELELYMHALGM